MKIVLFYHRFQEKFGEAGVRGNDLLIATDESLKELGVEQLAYLNRLRAEIQLLVTAQQKIDEELKKKEEEEKQTVAKELIMKAGLIPELDKNVRKWEIPHVLKWLGQLFPHSKLTTMYVPSSALKWFVSFLPQFMSLFSF